MKILKTVAVVLGLQLGACGLGGGGGGGGAPPLDPVPGAPPDPLAGVSLDSPEIFLDGPPFAETGKPYQAQVRFPDAIGPDMEAPGLVAYSLGNAPQGLSIDAVTGEVTWIPLESQAGEHEVVIALQIGSQSFSGSALILVQGIHLEASGPVSATSGGVVEALDPASAIFGTRLVIPPGAVSADQEVTIHSLVHPVVLPDGAIGMEFSPSQTFASPVLVEIGYKDSWVASLGLSDEHGLAVYYLNPASDAWEKMPGSVVDPVANKVSLTTTHFSTYALFAGDPGDLDPGLGLSMEESWQLFLGGSAASPPADASVYLSMKKDLWQPRGFVHVKGSGFKPHQKNALLIHGMFSKDTNFAALKSWASSRYDNVIFYNYPSGMPIRSNATWLAMQLLTNEALFPRISCIDVYAHSMGGLVARCAIEDPSTVFTRIIAPFVNVAMLGTPNLGGDVSGTWAGVKLHPGLKDLLPGSAFLNFLNALPGQGWAKYYAIAGDKGGGSDGWVTTGSAIPTGIFTLANGGVTSPQNHSDIHLNIATNGVGTNLASWVQTKTFSQEQIHLVSKETVVTHYPLGPNDFEYEYESVQVSATFSFDSDFYLPPWIVLTADWRPVDPYQSCYGLEIDKQILYIDDSFPQINELFLQHPEIFNDSPSSTIVIRIEPCPGQVTFLRKEFDVPVCPPPGYVPMPGVPVPPPQMELNLFVGSDGDEPEDALIAVGPF